MKKHFEFVSDPEVSKKFHLFREQTRKHEAILTRVIQQLGMDPTCISSGVKLATEKAEALLKTMTNGL